MEPTLHCGRPAPGCEADENDRVFAVPYGGSRPSRGDIVVFETPPAARVRCGAGGVYIKRVVGLPQERWSERNGRILVDGKMLPEPWVRPRRRDNQTFRGGKIPARRYLLLGDNRASSCDSRYYGLVPLENIRGKVVEIKRGSKVIHLAKVTSSARPASRLRAARPAARLPPRVPREAAYPGRAKRSFRTKSLAFRAVFPAVFL